MRLSAAEGRSATSIFSRVTLRHPDVVCRVEFRRENLELRQEEMVEDEGRV